MTSRRDFLKIFSASIAALAVNPGRVALSYLPDVNWLQWNVVEIVTNAGGGLKQVHINSRQASPADVKRVLSFIQVQADSVRIGPPGSPGMIMHLPEFVNTGMYFYCNVKMNEDAIAGRFNDRSEIWMDELEAGVIKL